MGSNIYTDDYTPNTSAIIIGLSKKLKNDLCTQQQQQQNQTQNGGTRYQFNERLKRLYSSLNKTLNLSTQILGNKPQHHHRSIKDLENSKLNNVEKQNTTANLNAAVGKNLNEYNSNDCELKFEKDVAIDKIRLFKSTPIKKTNIELEREFKKVPYLDRSENTYVLNPVSGDSVTDENKLQIYEVDFENNIAYIIPTVNEVSKQLKENEDAEIYQSINDSELENKHYYDDNQGLIPAESDKYAKAKLKINTVNVEQANMNEMSDDLIYSTPTNKLIENVDGDDRSVLRLVNDDPNETQA